MRFIAAAALLAAATALANDTTATIGAGGLVLEKTDSIDMVSEDLFVSTDLIRVRYVFRNRTARPVATVVAFPMPDRKMSDEYGGDVAFPSGFVTTVEGQRVAAALERKAMANGRDHRARLERLGVPVAPESIADATRAMDRLPAAERRALVADGLAGEEEYDDDGKGMKRHLIPLWTVQDRYWWRQTFPAGRDLRVEHRYAPGAGGSVTTGFAFKELRDTADGRWARARWCPDAAFLAAIDRRVAARGRDVDPGLPDRRIDYILTTGANWARPIGTFRLVVDKGRPSNLVTFCESGVRKTGPTRFEVVKRNFRPSRDLHVLIVEPRD